MKRVVLWQTSFEDPQVVRPQRAAGLRDLDDGVSELGRLDLGGAPTELDLGRDAVLLQVPRRQADRFRGDPLALQVLDALHGRRLRDAEHPADRAAADLREDQLRHLVDVGVVFHDPVVAGQPGVQHAVLDVARHFLGADQEALQLVVVDAGIIAPRVEGDFVARAAKQFTGRLLQAARGDAEFENVGHSMLSTFRSFLTVYRRRIKNSLAFHDQPLRRHAAEEATVIAFVAGGAADLFDLQQNRVFVAIDVNRPD